MLKFSWNWKLALFVACLLVILLRLGFWQLDREEEKAALQSLLNERLAQPTEPLDTFSDEVDLLYRQVEVTGKFDNQHLFFLDNRVSKGQVGFEVLQPLLASTGDWLLVNRGFIPQGPTRQELPIPMLFDEEVRLQGYLYTSLSETMTLGDITPTPGWPKIIQVVKIDQLSILSENTNQVINAELRLADQSPGVLERNWTLINTTPEKHFGYAMQWFSMAIALVALSLWQSFKKSDNE